MAIWITMLFLVAMPVSGFLLLLLYLVDLPGNRGGEAVRKKRSVPLPLITITPIALSVLLFTSLFDSVSHWIPLAFCFINAVWLLAGTYRSYREGLKQKRYLILSGTCLVSALFLLSLVGLSVYLM